jgi:hypothetical protein
MKKKILGLSGFARSGKDLFCAIAVDILEDEGIKAKRFALADKLKSDCEQFIKEKMKLDVYSQDSNEKSIFRPLLVTYGSIKRKQSEGTYWTELLQKQIVRSKCDVAIITDVRYAEYENDEIFWLKNIGGKLIHIKKYTTEPGFLFADRKIYTLPPNSEEERNDPIVQKHADCLVEWQSATESDDIHKLIHNPYLRGVVKDALLKTIGNFNEVLS